MAKEVELKVMNVNPVLLKQQLRDKKAKLVKPLHKQRRYVFDIVPGDDSRWIRLRSSGLKSTLAVKVINDTSIEGTDEYEVYVSNFEETLKMLSVMGFEPKSYQENFREAYMLDGVELSIDYWPSLAPYLELEGSDKESITTVLKKIGLQGRPTTSVNTMELYKQKSVDLNKIKKLVFSKDQEKSITMA